MTKNVKDVLTVVFDDVTLGVRSAAELWAGAACKSAEEACDEQCRRFINRVKKFSPPTNARHGGKILFKTIGEHRAWLHKKILVWRHRRGRYRPKGDPSAYLTAAEAPGYLKKSLEMEGGLPGNFAPLAKLVNAKGIPKWMSRHTNKFGNSAHRVIGDSARPAIDVRWTAPVQKHGEGYRYFVARGLESAEKGLATAAQKIVERAMKKAARSGARKGAAR